MNTDSKKLKVTRAISAFRTLAFSIMFFAFIILTLYVLINSPA